MAAIFYIGAPALVGLVFLLMTYLSATAFRPRDTQIQASLWLGVGQAAFAWFSVALTTANPISSVACDVGSLGVQFSLAVAALDGLNLMVWLVRRARGEGTFRLPLPYLFVLLRVLTHGGFATSFWWCAKLCTV